jgi:hypothetical protein
MSRFGEPWKRDKFNWTVLNKNGEDIFSDYTVQPGVLERAIICVNACTNIPDPEKTIPLLIKLAEKINRMDVEANG